MFELARRYVRTSLVFAAISVLLGMHMIAQRFSDKPQPLRWLPTAHGHLFLVGFVTMMIMGVAIWMFPRPKSARYSPLISEICYWLITFGTAVRATGEIVASYSKLKFWLWLSAIGGIAQSIAILLFIANIWTRIVPVGKLLKEDREPTPQRGDGE
ncbi:MAG: cbb3-type cytochrome c oxidase subunit I [Armatimonadetes bacterium]|nr:cbb3-type cytochrome c oxidase subunit I [Armatimonadota bacterium]MDW8029520.1 cbb3-type cytochrome c oxidase subunit I [Armatimonadota bacterium]